MRAPLEGIRVLDLTQGVAGPYATMLLAAQGADVIKIEPPEGDWLRRGANRVRGEAPAALAVNAGKRSIALDLKKPGARALAQRLAAGCDIVAESFRTGVAERLGLGPEGLTARAPSLVYCSIRGFPRHSALGHRPVIDHIAQAYSGWMSVNAPAGSPPARTRNVVLADQVTGLYASQAIVSALLRRIRFGEGQVLEVTLAGCMAAFLAARITSHALSDGRVGQAEFTPPTGDYETADGLLVIAVQKPRDVENLLAGLGRADLLGDPRFATPQARADHAPALREQLAAVLRTRAAREWERRLDGAGVMACEARDIGGFLASQQADGLGLVDSLVVPGLGPCPFVNIPGASPWTARADRAAPPRLGEHGVEILAQAGLSPDEIEQHIKAGDVALATTQ